ncbi:MAG: FMN-binding negative transcriptional regulator, partial [Armatimonadetes bacterium]|nr:FMN-binding negative transcriptional regulator [Armatimonadota bacterium]
LLDRARGPHGTLRGHVARANPQARQLTEAVALAIFLGPHAYISPTWYQTRPAVPTWSYVTVHAYGTPRLLDDAATATLLDDLVRKHEAGLPEPWDGVLPDDLAANLRAAVVGFELPIDRIEGKLKLGQNRSAADQQGVRDALVASPRAGDQALAAWLRGDHSSLEA